MTAAALPLPGAQPTAQPTSLPPLRQDLALHTGPRLRNGQPSWTLHDPAKHQYHQPDWLSFEVLAHRPQDGEHGPEAIAAAIAAETTLQPEVHDVLMVLDFLQRNELVHRPGAPSAAQRHGAFKWLLHNDLFFRIPLLRPDALLGALLPLLGLVFSRAFLGLTALAGIAGLALVARQWESFQATLVDLLTPAGLASYALTLVGVKTLHELDHALVARRHGRRVPTMGLAFMVLWPVPDTDTNDAWRLADRWARLQIAAAGVATELLVAVWVTLAWAILPDGGTRQAAFLLATTTWVSTLLVNCSPFMRFDGYFVLSDWLEMPNLHQRSFALARWQLREWLFNLRAEPPEHVAPARRRDLVLFAFFVWAYRLTLFLGIALLVYGFFIKRVGIFLFAVEIIWFVLMPIAAEVKTWGRLWPVIRLRPRSGLSLVLLAAGLAALACPLPDRLGASGLLHTGTAQVVYAPAAGRIARLAVADGATVRAGTPLLVLGSEQEREPLATVVNPDQWQVEAYLSEADLKRIAVGQQARFDPDGRFGSALDLQVSAIAHDASHQLPAPGLAAAAGGSVATREVDGRHVPEHAVYRVTYTVDGRPQALAGQVWRGHVVTEAQPESVLQRLARAALAVWWREAGW